LGDVLPDHLEDEREYTDERRLVELSREQEISGLCMELRDPLSENDLQTIPIHQVPPSASSLPRSIIPVPSNQHGAVQLTKLTITHGTCSTVQGRGMVLRLLLWGCYLR